MRINVSLIFLFVCVQFIAQTPTVQLVASKTEVKAGEQFNIELIASVNGNGDVQFPKEFQVINRFSGSSTQIINGIRRVEIKRTFSVICNQPGTYEIPAVTWTYDNNKKITSKSLKIVVTQSAASSNSQNAVSANGDKHFGILSTSKKSVYVGEPFILSGKVFFDGHIVDVNTYVQTEADLSVHKSDLGQTKSQLSVQGEVVGSKYMETIELFEELIVPQQSGEISFSPFSINIGFQRGFFNTNFVGVRSNDLKINVKPLPENAPVGFNGAVGQFSIQTKSDAKSQTEVGDIIAYTIRVEGKGNIHLFTPIRLNLPQGIQLYGEPTTDDQVVLAKKGAYGHIEYEFILQIQEPGTYEFEPFQFAYFDPESEKYKTVDVPEIKFTASGEISGIDNQNSPKNGDETEKRSRKLYTFLLIAVFLLLTFAVIGVFLKLKKRQTREAGKVEKPKIDYKKAAIDALQQINVSNLSETISQLEKVQQDYFRGLLKDNSAFLNHETIDLACEHKHISSEIAEQWKNHLSSLQALKYGNLGSDDPQRLVDKTIALIKG